MEFQFSSINVWPVWRMLESNRNFEIKEVQENQKACCSKIIFLNNHEKSTNHAFIYSIMVGRNKYYNFEWSSVICYRRWRILIRDSNSSRPLFLMKLPLVLYAFLFGIMLSPFRTRFFVRLYVYFKYFSSSLRAVQCSVQRKIWRILCASLLLEVYHNWINGHQFTQLSSHDKVTTPLIDSDIKTKKKEKKRKRE